MRFLVDNNLSPQVAHLLREAGHDAVHLRDYGMQSAPDPDVMVRARVEERVLISADTDFGTLLAQERAIAAAHSPPCRSADRRHRRRGSLEPRGGRADLEAGAIVVLGEDSIRIRRLPVLPR